MWRKLLDYLACPDCQTSLGLHELEPTSGSEPNGWIDCALLLCDSCHTMYPVVDGLPVMLRYQTPAAAHLQQEHGSGLARVGNRYGFAKGVPEPGEEFVLRSFSREWMEYDYDGVMWDLSYEDHERRFLAECGAKEIALARGGLFIEIGCGLGMSTVMGQKHMGGDAIGFDLGHAAGRAVGEFKTNDKLHFVQASAFHLPLKAGAADFVYSHGVLHHTYSTEKAVKAVAPMCKPGGTFYLWLYGPESLKGSPLRRFAWAAEANLRPWIARNLDSVLAGAFLRTAGLGYLAVNRYHRLRDPTVQPYNFGRALHAVRDRFTPLFAFRHDFPEVASWFDASGFEDVIEVDWRTMPTANQDNYRRNTGVRGQRARD